MRKKIIKTKIKEDISQKIVCKPKRREKRDQSLGPGSKNNVGYNDS